MGGVDLPGISFGDCHVSGAFSKPHQGHALTAESRGLVEKHAFGVLSMRASRNAATASSSRAVPLSRSPSRGEAMPRLFWIVAHDTLGFLEESWFGDQDERITATLERSSIRRL